jgi:hypothetical protein
MNVRDQIGHLHRLTGEERAGEGEHDRAGGDQQRQQRADHAPEEQQQNEQRDRQHDHLRGRQVVADGRVGVVPQGRLAADERGREALWRAERRADARHQAGRRLLGHRQAEGGEGHVAVLAHEVAASVGSTHWWP